MDLVKENYTIYLHQNIRWLRKRLNLSQEELASRIGLNRGNIASYENGTAEPKICNLLKMSTLFGVSMMDLTQKDLSSLEFQEPSNQNLEGIPPSDIEIIRQLTDKSEEIELVFKGLYTCCQFRANAMGELPKDAQILLSNFEQLYEAAQSLLCNHKALLDFIRHKVKS